MTIEQIELENRLDFFLKNSEQRDSALALARWVEDYYLDLDKEDLTYIDRAAEEMENLRSYNEESKNAYYRENALAWIELERVRQQAVLIRLLAEHFS